MLPVHRKKNYVTISNVSHRVLLSSVQFSYSIYVSRSLIIKIMMTALMLSSYAETFKFSAGQRTVRVSVMSFIFISDARLFHDNGPATFSER